MDRVPVRATRRVQIQAAEAAAHDDGLGGSVAYCFS